MEALKDVLENVNGWLKFAEAKNAVLVTTSGVALWAGARLLVSDEIGCYLQAYLCFLIVFLGAALITGLLSFLPVLSYSIIVPKPYAVDNENLLYFGYLSTLSKNELVKKFLDALDAPDTEQNAFHPMYAEQIIINSRVALAKYALFERGVNLIILGALTPVVGGLLLYAAKNKRKATDGVG
ncbi:MAG: hypothetical protein KKF24_08580 [Gammaproteobacteria bacterium]|nr:hypothetical protein [Gammaproteobacteria bacterium]MBU1832735.1 hypothetical protein [Gammaproteobacteria bacterium]